MGEVVLVLIGRQRFQHLQGIFSEVTFVVQFDVGLLFLGLRMQGVLYVLFRRSDETKVMEAIPCMCEDGGVQDRSVVGFEVPLEHLDVRVVRPRPPLAGLLECLELDSIELFQGLRVHVLEWGRVDNEPAVWVRLGEDLFVLLFGQGLKLRLKLLDSTVERRCFLGLNIAETDAVLFVPTCDASRFRVPAILLPLRLFVFSWGII